MICTTTGNIDGRSVKTYLDIVSGEALIGTSNWQDVLAKLRDVLDGRTADYDKMLHKAKDDVLYAMKQQAENLGANAILGIHFHFETIDHLLLVSVSGTAVVIE